MIKQMLILCAFSASFAGLACDVTHSTADENVRKIVKENGWGFHHYDAVCEKLRRANAALVTDGDATVLGNKSIAWATVGLKDKELMVFTNAFGGSSTKTNDYASMDTARKMLMEAINSAVNNMDLDKAIQSLNENRRQVKQAYSR